MGIIDWYHTVTFRLTRRWAEHRSSEAQFNLGYLYYIGKGVAQDYAEAANWYRRAADQGFVSAMYNLGFSYQNGQGVPQDDVLAHMWFDLAASRSAGWKEMREEAMKARDDIASRMTPAGIAEAQRLAREWKPKKEQ